MPHFYKKIDRPFAEFIADQKFFMVATAPTSQGRVNVSPKGLDTFRILDETRVAYLDLTGSGNETAAHVSENKRITFMFMSFGKQPMILRLYSTARFIQPGEEGWDDLYALFPDHPGVRQIFVADVEMVQTSCGYGVPQYEYKGERPTLDQWAVGQGEGIFDHWNTFNMKSIDGLPTHLNLDHRDYIGEDV